MSGPPRAITVTGVSGCGKDAIVSQAMDELNGLGIGWVKSITTRSPRDGERDGGSPYLDFVSKEEFVRMRDAGELLEWDEVDGEMYGTRDDAFLTSGSRGGVKIATVNGMTEIRKVFEEKYGVVGVERHIAVYISVPEDEMCHRLRDNRGWNDDRIQRRIDAIPDGYGPDEVSDPSMWDAVIDNSNGRLDDAVDEFVMMIRNAVLSTGDTPLDRSKLLMTARIVSAYGGSHPNIRDGDAYESCRTIHLSSAGGEWAYPTIPERAEAILKGIIRHHPFTDCNKRTAVVVTEEYLNNHGWRWAASQRKKLDQVMTVARGDSVVDVVDPKPDMMEGVGVNPLVAPRVLSDGVTDLDRAATLFAVVRNHDVIMSLAQSADGKPSEPAVKPAATLAAKEARTSTWLMRHPSRDRANV